MVKVFSMAHQFLPDMNLDDICQPLDFLLRNKQQSQGNFIEDNPVRDLSMAVRLNQDHSELNQVKTKFKT